LQQNRRAHATKYSLTESLSLTVSHTWVCVTRSKCEGAHYQFSIPTLYLTFDYKLLENKSFRVLTYK